MNACATDQFRIAAAMATRMSMTVQALTVPMASAAASCPRRLIRAKDSVTDVDEMSPPRDPAAMIPIPGPTNRRAIHARKLRPEKRSTNAQRARGFNRTKRSASPAGKSGSTTNARTAKRATRAQRDVVHPAHECVQPALFKQEDDRRGDDRGGENQLAASGRRAGRENDDGGDFGRRVDILPDSTCVTDRDERQRARYHDGRNRHPPSCGKPTGDAAETAKERERANAAEMRVRSGRFTRPFAFETDRGATERRDSEAADWNQDITHSHQRATARLKTIFVESESQEPEFVSGTSPGTRWCPGVAPTLWTPVSW